MHCQGALLCFVRDVLPRPLCREESQAAHWFSPLLSFLLFLLLRLHPKAGITQPLQAPFYTASLPNCRGGATPAKTPGTLKALQIWVCPTPHIRASSQGTWRKPSWLMISPSLSHRLTEYGKPKV